MRQAVHHWPAIAFLQVPHQDSTFLYTNPMSCIGLWLALEDANKDNGCLWAIKGIHKQGLSRRFKRLPEGGVGFDGPAATYDLSQVGPASEGLPRILLSFACPLAALLM